METQLRRIALLCFALGPATALAQDADNDGVFDGADAFPCDSSASAVSYAPARGVHGLVQFEDEWPHQTDFDFNDVVVAYNFVLAQNAAGQTTTLRATFDVLALGGVFDNGLALGLGVPASAVASAAITLDGGPAQPLSVRAGDTQAVLELSRNLRALFGGQADQINSRADLAPQSGQVIELTVTFASPVALGAAEAPFDLFIFRSTDDTHEIHGSSYCGTARMNTALFGQGLDGSTPTRCFVDARNLPFALSMPEQAPYPKEGTDIALLYPSILDFASSGGASSKGYYLTPAAGFGFTPTANPRFVNGVDLPVDLSCNPSTTLGSPTHRMTVDVTNPSGTTLSGYQVEITVNTAAMIAAGRLAADCSNLRVSDASFNRIPHWITARDKACGATDTRVWAKVGSIPPGGTTLYLFYGESGASDVSDGRATFEFFDDFEGPSLDTANWATLSGTSFTQSAGVLKETRSRSCGNYGEADVYYRHGFGWTDYVFEADVYAETSWYPGIVVRVQNAGLNTTSMWWHEWNTQSSVQGTLRPFVNNRDYSWSYTWYNTTPTSRGVWRTARARVFGSNYQSWLNYTMVNDLRPVSSSHRVSSGTVGLNQHCGYQSPQIVWFDNARVAKTVEPAPVASAPRAETAL